MVAHLTNGGGGGVLQLLGAVNFQKFMILYWQYHVLGHHQRSEVDNHLSVNTQLPTADDGVGLL